MPDCAYCGDSISRTGGKLLIQNSGAKRYFCSNKCEQNWHRDRNLEYADAE